MNNNIRAWYNWNAWAIPLVPVSTIRAGQVLYQDGCIIRNGPGTDRYVLPYQYDTLNTWAGGAWPIGGNLATFDDPVPAASDGMPIVRHRGRVNQAFFDGHVASVSGRWIHAEQTAAFRR